MIDMHGQNRPDVSVKLAQVWKAYRLPVVLGMASLLAIAVALTILIKSVQTSTPITFSSGGEASVAAVMRGGEVVVDVAGAVVKPGVYTLPSGSRVEDAIIAAGGLSGGVDDERLAKVVNRAAKLSDGAKLYIPTSSPNLPNSPNSPNFFNPVSVNAASQQELESLSGIGPATATKIIQSRPYTSLEELVAKKAMGQALFDKLKNQLTL